MLNDRTSKFAAACLAALSKHATRPINPPAPDLSTSPRIQIMRSTEQQKKDLRGHVSHFPIPSERKTALDIIRWCYAVANLRADSPRFAYYVSRWNVPFKVERAISSGTFDEITANFPPIDPSWIRFVPAALEAHRQFTAPRRPKTDSSKSSGNKARAA